jgi:hypothetical protein
MTRCRAMASRRAWFLIAVATLAVAGQAVAKTHVVGRPVLVWLGYHGTDQQYVFVVRFDREMPRNPTRHYIEAGVNLAGFGIRRPVPVPHESGWGLLTAGPHPRLCYQQFIDVGPGGPHRLRHPWLSRRYRYSIVIKNQPLLQGSVKVRTSRGPHPETFPYGSPFVSDLGCT